MNARSRALPVIEIAIPCHQDWDRMKGTGRTRFCGSCSRNVYDVAQLSQAEMVALVARHEGPVPCLRILRRPDGTVVTRDCFARLRAGGRLVWARLAAVVALAFAYWGGVLGARALGQRVAAVLSRPSDGWSRGGGAELGVSVPNGQASGDVTRGSPARDHGATEMLGRMAMPPSRGSRLP